MTAASEQQQVDPNAVLEKYQQLQRECNELVNKITVFEQERNEHRLVEETLLPLDPNRKAFRLIGGILVERTVGDVLPTVVNNRENIEGLIKSFEKQLETVRKETIDWKMKYKIKTSEERDNASRS